MSIKLLLLKSGEDLIADVTEMAVGEDENKRVVGYFLNKPCTIKMPVSYTHLRAHETEADLV